MSLQSMQDVWNSSESKGGDRLVLLAIADVCNEYGQCYTKLKTIAAKCFVSVRAVQMSIKRLEGLRELVVNESTGRGYANDYFVLPPDSQKRLSEYLENLATEPERARNFTLFDALKRVKFDAERVKFDAERVKPTSPQLKNNYQQKNKRTKGKTHKPSKPVGSHEPPEIPNELKTIPGFNLAFEAWVEMRNNHKKHSKITPLVLKLALQTLFELHGQNYDVVRVIKRSAASSWADFYPKPEDALKVVPPDKKPVSREHETLQEMYARMDALADGNGMKS